MKKQIDTKNKGGISKAVDRLKEAISSNQQNTNDVDIKAILRRRANDLSKALPKETKGSYFEYIQFALADEIFGIEKEFVKEVFFLKDLTPLPCVPNFIVGIINNRGKILSVIDLKKFYDLPDAGITELNSVILLQNNQLEFAILTDKILGVAKAYKDELLKTLPTLKGIREDFLKGITPERVIILDQNKILNDERLIINEQV
jgi:purine-binding chemotaxis protein CheW